MISAVIRSQNSISSLPQFAINESYISAAKSGMLPPFRHTAVSPLVRFTWFVASSGTRYRFSPEVKTSLAACGVRVDVPLRCLVLCIREQTIHVSGDVHCSTHDEDCRNVFLDARIHPQSLRQVGQRASDENGHRLSDPLTVFIISSAPSCTG